jgi:hypothetical protein
VLRGVTLFVLLLSAGPIGCAAVEPYKRGRLAAPMSGPAAAVTRAPATEPTSPIPHALIDDLDLDCRAMAFQVLRRFQVCVPRHTRSRPVPDLFERESEVELRVKQRGACAQCGHEVIGGSARLSAAKQQAAKVVICFGMVGNELQRTAELAFGAGIFAPLEEV